MQIAFLSSRRLALIAGAMVALAPMVAAQADEADGSEHALQFQSQRSRADLARAADDVLAERLATTYDRVVIGSGPGRRRSGAREAPEDPGDPKACLEGV